MRIKTFIICLFISFSALAQSPYKNLSFDAAIDAAKKENKIVMMVIQSAACKQCNEVADAGISTSEAKKVIDANCILIRSPKVPKELSSIAAFNDDYFGVLFFDTEKNLIHAFNSSSSMGRLYTDNIDTAVKQLNAGGTSLSALKKQFFSANASMQGDIQLIQKLQSLHLDPSAQVTDDLIQKAPADSANSITFLQFVMRTAPVVNAESRKYLTKNIDNYNMAWYRMTLQERVQLNAKTIDRSLKKAIAEKDMAAIYGVSAFVGSAYQTNAETAMRMREDVMLKYYRGVNDTANFVRSAINFYDRFFMTISLASIRKQDSAYMAKQSEMAVTQATINGYKRTFVAMAVGPRAQYVAGELNNAAWTLYKYSETPANVNKALSWSKRAAEIYEGPEIMDTYARLLYKTGNTEEAVDWETKVIAKLKEVRRPTTDYEKVLEQMKAKKDKIDLP
jgi:hypothetical protein